MKAVAIKTDQTREQAPAFQPMGMLRCAACGEEFVVFHNPTFADKKAAERQARWLEKVLATENERERKHADRIQLPFLMRKTRLRWLPLAAAASHVFLFGLTSVFYTVQQQPIVGELSGLSFWIVFLTDLPVSWIALGAMSGWPHAAYYFTAWLVLGTLWWYLLGLLIQVKMSEDRR